MWQAHSTNAGLSALSKEIGCKCCQGQAHLDVDSFLGRLLQLALINVDDAVLKGEAVNWDAVLPGSSLQATVTASVLASGAQSRQTQTHLIRSTADVPLRLA